MLPNALHSDPAVEKLHAIPLLSMPLLAARPFPAPPTPPLPPPARRISREEFRRRLIETIDEALRIIDDNSEGEGTDPQEN